MCISDRGCSLGSFAVPTDTASVVKLTRSRCGCPQEIRARHSQTKAGRARRQPCGERPSAEVASHDIGDTADSPSLDARRLATGAVEDALTRRLRGSGPLCALAKQRGQDRWSDTLAENASDRPRPAQWAWHLMNTSGLLIHPRRGRRASRFKDDRRVSLRSESTDGRRPRSACSFGEKGTHHDADHADAIPRGVLSA